jgi:hypothetical protein
MSFVILAFALVMVAESSQAFAESFLSHQEDAMVAKVNAHRATHGESKLKVNTAYLWVARRQAQRMVAAGYIYHNPNLMDDADKAVPDWLDIGENVGVGPDGDAVFEAFLESKPHHHNIDFKTYTTIGLGAMASGDGAMYFTQDFARLAGKASTPPKTSPPKTSPPKTGGTVRHTSAPPVLRVKTVRPAPARTTNPRPKGKITPAVLALQEHARASRVTFEVLGQGQPTKASAQDKVSFVSTMVSLLQRFASKAADAADVPRLVALALMLGNAWGLRRYRNRRPPMTT